MKIRLGKGQAAQNTRNLTFTGVAVAQLIPVGQGVILFHETGQFLTGYEGHTVFHGPQLIPHIENVLLYRGDLLPQRAGTVNGMLLGQIAVGGIMGKNNGTLIRGDFPDDHT